MNCANLSIPSVQHQAAKIAILIALYLQVQSYLLKQKQKETESSQDLPDCLMLCETAKTTFEDRANALNLTVPRAWWAKHITHEKLVAASNSRWYYYGALLSVPAVMCVTYHAADVMGMLTDESRAKFRAIQQKIYKTVMQYNVTTIIRFRCSHLGKGMLKRSLADFLV